MLELVSIFRFRSFPVSVGAMSREKEDPFTMLTLISIEPPSAPTPRVLGFPTPSSRGTKSAYWIAANDCAEIRPLSGSWLVVVVNENGLGARGDGCVVLCVNLGSLALGPGDFGAAVKTKLWGLPNDAYVLLTAPAAGDTVSVKGVLVVVVTAGGEVVETVGGCRDGGGVSGANVCTGLNASIARPAETAGGRLDGGGVRGANVCVVLNPTLAGPAALGNGEPAPLAAG